MAAEDCKISRSKGVTITELVITLAVMGVVIMACRSGITFLNAIARQKKTIEIRLISETTFFNIVRDIRNAHSIIEASPTRLVLRQYDFKNFSPASPEMFQAVNIGTTTYEVQTENNQTFLLRKIEIPFGETVQSNQLLKGLLIPADAENYLFKGGPNENPPFDKVEVLMRLNAPWAGDQNIEYREVVRRRGGIH